jgi:predicted O-methyltransferase YrrM
MNRIKVTKQFENISAKNLRIMIKFILVHPLHSFFTLYHKALYETIYKDYISELLNGKNCTIVSPDEFLKKEKMKLEKDVIIKHTQNTIHLIETSFLLSLIKGINAKLVFEIGTYKGATTSNIAYNLAKSGKIYTIDLPPGFDFVPGELFQNDKKVRDSIIQLHGDSTQFDFSPFYGKIDLMFIDGNHRYEYVLSDSENAVKCVKKNGYIVWDDFSDKYPGTMKAVSDTCLKYGLQLFHITGTKFAICKNTLKKE